MGSKTLGMKGRVGNRAVRKGDTPQVTVMEKENATVTEGVGHRARLQRTKARHPRPCAIAAGATVQVSKPNKTSKSYQCTCVYTQLGWCANHSFTGKCSKLQKLRNSH